MLFFDLGAIPMFFGGIAVIGFQVRNVRRLSKQSHAISPKPELDWRDRAVVRLQEMYAEGKIEEIDIAGDSLFERAIQTCLDAKSWITLEADLRGMGLYDVCKAPSVVECPPPIPAPPFTVNSHSKKQIRKQQQRDLYDCRCTVCNMPLGKSEHTRCAEILSPMSINLVVCGENHLIKEGTTYDHQYVPQVGITQYYSSWTGPTGFNSPAELAEAAKAALAAGTVKPREIQKMLFPESLVKAKVTPK